MPEQKVSYLLGAGASKDAGLPLSDELLERLLNELQRRGRESGNVLPFRLMSFVVQVYIDYFAQLAGSHRTAPDIETVISAVEMLGNQDELEIRPFIQQLSSGAPVTLADGTQFPVISLLDFSRQQECRVLLYESRRCLRAILRLPNDSDVSYLHPLLRRAKAEDVTIATLNYDMTIETAAEQLGVVCSDGIDKWSREWVLEWQSPGVRLMKIHGSIHWEDRFEGPKNLDPGGLAIGSSTVIGDDAFPLILFGRSQKLSHHGPFLDLRAQFVEDLRATSHLVTIGYSFGDAHVNELVRHWLRADPHRILVVVDPSVATRWTEESAPFYKHLLMFAQEQDGPFVGSSRRSRILPIKATAREAMEDVCAGPDRLNQLLLERNPLMQSE